MLKKILPLLALTLTLPLASGCMDSTAKGEVFLKEVAVQESKSDIEVPEDIRTAMFELSEEITPDYFAASEKENQMFSPLSLWYALGVLREGAAGETLAELDRMMKLPSAFTSSGVIPQLSKSLNFMQNPVRSSGTKNGIRLTSGIFLDEAYRENILDAWLDTAAGVWSTETAAVDFTDGPGTKEIIRDWVSRKTDEFIPDYEATFPTDGSGILNIYNVLYLKDQWQTMFHELAEEEFQTAGGSVRVPYLAGQINTANYVDTELVQGAAFPGETGIRVWFLLPREGMDPSGLLPGLQEIMDSEEQALVNFRAPQLELDGDNISLRDLLMARGYTSLFTEAELDLMLEGMDAVVGDIKQKAKLVMDHRGFEAAAVTEVALTTTGAPADDPVELTIDRPYLLVIEHEGLPLFIARIMDPSEK